MDYELLFTCLCLLTIAGCALLAVLHPLFDDTAVQRVCLGGVCMFSLGAALQFWRTDYAPGVVQWLIWFIAGYAVETSRKLRRKARK
jgi:peptidoglycan/LPS O-acetylase OafA/YrhL